MTRRLAAAAALAVILAGAGGCGYRGSAVHTSPQAVAAVPGWITVPGVRLVEQEGTSDCGAAALAMLLAFWGSDAPLAEISRLLPAPPEGKGQRAGDLRDLARSRGLEAFLVRGELADLQEQLAKGRPVLVGLRKPIGLARGKRQRVLSHYELVIGIHPERRQILTLDPAEGLRRNSLDGFAGEWDPADRLALIAFRKPD